MPIYYPSLTSIDINETRRYAGLIKTTSFQPDMLEAVCVRAQLFANPRASWSIFHYEKKTGEILANPPVTLCGQSILKHLRQAISVAVVAVTIGDEIEKKITEYFGQGRYTEALLLDAAASAAVEQATDQVNNIISKHANKEGLTAIARFSPGYGDWSIQSQPEILKLAQARQIGIDITSSYMLIPRKSVTAIIGLTPAENKSTLQACASNNCNNCSQINCLARKEYQ